MERMARSLNPTMVGPLTPEAVRSKSQREIREKLSWLDRHQKLELGRQFIHHMIEFTDNNWKQKSSNPEVDPTQLWRSRLELLREGIVPEEYLNDWAYRQILLQNS